MPVGRVGLYNYWLYIYYLSVTLVRETEKIHAWSVDVSVCQRRAAIQSLAAATLCVSWGGTLSATQVDKFYYHLKSQYR